jgi:hypothetical protein
MAEKKSCAPGDWVEVEWVLLTPEERADGLPAETASKPLTVWVKGFARAEAVLGGELTVETMTRRLVTGRLSDLEPGYFHTFGKPIAELTHVGADLRERLAAYRKAGG